MQMKLKVVKESDIVEATKFIHTAVAGHDDLSIGLMV